MSGAVYCGAPPLPDTLIARFNLDPVLIAALVAVAALHLRANPSMARRVLIGWGVAAAALISPLCALSVSLFAARIAQHMILLLAAAPLVASALPCWRTIATPRSLWSANAAFLALLWFWHMPNPYTATFASPAVYWAMHLSLSASGVWLWVALLRQHTPQALAAGTLASVQMGLLGAVISLASWPMYAPHYLTTEVWGLTPIQDQQLGGTLMWVPGCLLFLGIAVRSLAKMWRSMDEAAA
ncbi:cytochrome c oxidase assembly protein [Sphingomonas panacisoli]|uniref:Cytochrome c oxidase assembly protein n=1 Tax=Sphingomonas panacisoli TaxID=1813879 RepID=A0A5B8LFK9_9SPHN|nr:cytochrome c oxidase assembly protein [Sphingomonas panacisoli]QDZ06871.1 cytochrome c oxidase assembly protein [Sphingomonas panacisoli]